MTIATLKSINIEVTDNLFGGAFRLLLAGVGFLKTEQQGRDQYYDVFSHGGDYIGRIPFQMVASIIWYMRHQYKCEYDKIENGTITYGWSSLITNEENEKLQDDFFRKPLEIF